MDDVLDRIWGDEADTQLHIYRNPDNGSVRFEIVTGDHGILGSITLTNWRLERLVSRLRKDS